MLVIDQSRVPANSPGLLAGNPLPGGVPRVMTRPCDTASAGPHEAGPWSGETPMQLAKTANAVQLEDQLPLRQFLPVLRRHIDLQRVAAALCPS